MRITLNILGVLLVVFGFIGFLQGSNMPPGSLMTGQIQWTVYGAVAVAPEQISCVANRRSLTGRR